MKSRTFTTHVNTTNKAAETTYYTILGERIENLSLFLACSGGVTVTLEACLVASPTGTDWVDVTESLFSMKTGVGNGQTGGGATSYVDSNDILKFLNTVITRGFRVKCVTADDSNAVKIVTCVEGDNIQISQ